MNQDESAAMWELYLGNGPGLAVESSFGALREELDRATGKTAIATGSVDYLDYPRDSWGPYQSFNAVFHKRRSFDHERELRAVVVRPALDELTSDEIAQTARRARPELTCPWRSRWFTGSGHRPDPHPGSRSSSRQSASGQAVALPLVRSTLYDAPSFSWILG
jgi:hypothetical protein